jgi:hypothetical protein
MSPTNQGLPESPQTPVVEGKYWPARERSVPWEEDIIRLATFEDGAEDKDRLGSILLIPQGSMV